MEAQLEYIRFCMFGADLHAQSELINKICASELSRKFIKDALLVGYAQLLHYNKPKFPARGAIFVFQT